MRTTKLSAFSSKSVLCGGWGLFPSPLLKGVKMDSDSVSAIVFALGVLSGICFSHFFVSRL